MKTLSTLAFLTATLLSFTSFGQDRIVTVTGSTITGRVKKINDDHVSYRKMLRHHEIKSKKVLWIENRDGSTTHINNITTAKHYKDYSQLAKNSPFLKQDQQGQNTNTNTNPSFKPVHIERVGNSFRIDSTRLVGPKEINKIVSQSPNPMVKLQLKTAKMMRAFTIASKISSYPGSMSGAYASFQTFSTLFDQLKAGPAPFKTYLNAGLSFMGTITLPITNKILKHFQDKMYDKTLTLYSMGG